MKAIAAGMYHSMAIRDVSSPPVAVDDLYDVNEDDTFHVAAPGVLDNDTDANSDPLTAGVSDDAQHGTLTLDPDGSFTYAPDGDFHGTVHGDAGDDTLLGGDGRDRLYGNEGDDRLYGGMGTELVNGGSGGNFTQQ